MTPLLLTSPQDTQRAAFELAKQLVGGEWIALEGPLGAGKTTFVQGLAKSLGVTDPVRSPTYGLVHLYKTTHPTIGFLVHVDLYRLSEVAPEDVGLDEWVGRKDAVVVIEWPDRLALTPAWTHRLCLQPSAEHEHARLLTVV